MSGIFSVLQSHVDWLSQRYAVSATNVANSDTPGFRAMQIADFKNTMENVNAGEMARTASNHLSASPTDADTYDVSYQKNSDVSHSGNDVALEKEMAMIGDTSRRLSFDTSVERMFHHMFISSLKG